MATLQQSPKRVLKNPAGYLAPVMEPESLPPEQVQTGQQQAVKPNTVAGATGDNSIQQPRMMDRNPTLASAMQRATTQPDGTVDYEIPTFQGAKGVPVTREVAQNELVQGQLARILGSDSPVLKDARGQAMLYANERGLQNSSIAAEAGEKALIETALQIATPDAATYGRQALTNQDAENQFEMANVGARNNAEMANIAFAQQRQLNTDTERAQARAAADNFEKQKVLFEKDADLRRELTSMDIGSRNFIAQMQTSAANANAAAARDMEAARIASNERIAGMDAQIRQSQFSDDLAFRQRALDANTQTQLTANSANLQANAIQTYTNQFTAIMGNQMDPEDRERALQNLNAMWAGSPYLPPGFFSSSAFSGNTTTTPPSGSGSQPTNNESGA